jgi:hypothetical protein
MACPSTEAVNSRDRTIACVTYDIGLACLLDGATGVRKFIGTPVISFLSVCPFPLSICQELWDHPCDFLERLVVVRLLVKVLRSATISKLLIYRNTVEVKYK